MKYTIIKLYGQYTEQMRKFFLFGFVGAFGIVINTFLLYTITRADINYVIASIIATEVAIISNFFGNNYLTFKDSNNSHSLVQKFLQFQSISLISLIITVSILTLFVELFGSELLLLWNFFAICVAFISNFVLNLKITWSKGVVNDE